MREKEEGGRPQMAIVSDTNIYIRSSLKKYIAH